MKFNGHIFQHIDPKFFETTNPFEKLIIPRMQNANADTDADAESFVLIIKDI